MAQQAGDYQRLADDSANYGSIKDPQQPSAVEDYSVGPPERASHVVVFRDASDVPEDPKFQISYLPFLVWLSNGIVYGFVVCGILDVIIVAVSLVTLNTLLGMLAITAINVFGGVLGAFGVYRWGTVMEQIDKFKEETNKQEQEIDFLRTSRTKLQGEVSQIERYTKNLEEETKELETELGQFDELVDSLKGIAEDNQEINELIDSTLNLFTDMQAVMMRVERASLIELFYQVCFRDGDQAIDENEWPRFLGRLPKSTRAILEGIGGWSELSDDTNHIRLPNFEKEILPKILERIDVGARLNEHLDE